MPNHIGAFLKASRRFAELGVNTTRVSYNKAVDSKALCTREQKAIFQRLGVGQWQVFSGHGGKPEYTVCTKGPHSPKTGALIRRAC